MGKSAPDPSVIVGILVDRIIGLPAKEIADKWGYKTPTISTLSARYKLEQSETAIRTALNTSGQSITPEAIRVNQSYSKMANKLEDKLKTELDLDRDVSEFKDPLDFVRYHSTLTAALTKAREMHLSIAGLESESKRNKAKQEKIEDPKTSFEDLLEDCDEDE